MRKEKILSLSIILVIAGITVFFAVNFGKIRTSNEVMDWLPKENKIRKSLDKIYDIFGDGNPILIGIKVKEGTILSKENLVQISDFSDEINKIAKVKSVSNLINTDYLEGKEGEIIVTKLAEKIPSSSEEIASLKHKLESWDMYKDHLYSADFKSTTIVVDFGTETGTDERMIIYGKIKKISQNYESGRMEFYFAGDPVFSSVMDAEMGRDLGVLLPIVLLVLIMTLFLLFRKPGGILLPIITVIICVIWTMGLSGFINMPISIILTVVPVILIAVGSAYGIHPMSHYYDESGNDTAASEQNGVIRIVKNTLKKTGLPVFLSALTTMAGFGTLAFTEVIPVKNFGILSTAGVLFAFVIAITLIPSILVLASRIIVRKEIKTVKTAAKKIEFIEGFLESISYAVLKRKKTVAVIAVITAILSLAGLFLVPVDNNMVNFFKEGTVIRKADTFMKENLAGAYMLDILVESKYPGGLYHPDALKAVDGLLTELKKDNTDIRKIISYTDLVKRMNQVMNADLIEDRSYYEIPYDMKRYGLTTKDELRELVTQYMMLFSGDASDFIDDSIEPSKAKITLFLGASNSQIIRKIEKDLDDYAGNLFPENITYELTGNSKAETALNDMVINIKITNIIQSILLVFLILTIAYRSFTAGLISMIPVALSVLINFGVMGFFGIKLNLATAMISSITVGTGIDYTIHFLNSYHHNRKIFYDNSELTSFCMKNAGKSIIFNAISVAAGFAVLLFSSFVPLIHFGILMCLSMITSSMAALFILPLILNFLKPKFLSR